MVGYKQAKAIFEVLVGVLLLSLTAVGLADHLREVAVHIRHHAVEAWSIALAERLVRASTKRNLLVIGVASLLDGALSASEGWALCYRYRWSRWFVVGTSSILVPFEVLALAHRFSVPRLGLLGANVSIVIYLVWRGVATASPSSLEGISVAPPSKSG